MSCRFRPLAFLLIALLALLSASAPVAAKKKKPKRTFLYLFAPDQLRAWELVEGALEPTNPPFVLTNASSFLGDGDHQSMVYDPKFKLLLVAGNGGMRGLPVGKDGTPDGTAPGPTEFGFTGVSSAKRGDKVFAYGMRPFSDDIVGFKLKKSGELTLLPDGFPFTTVDKPQGCSVLGSTLFVAGEGEGEVAAYEIGKKGDLTELAGSPNSDPGSLIGVWPDPVGGKVYAPDLLANQVFGYEVTPNGLAELADSPFASTVNVGLGMAIGPADLHYAIGPAGKIVAFRRQGDGDLVQLGAAQTGWPSDPDCAAQSPDGNFLVVVNGNAEVVRLYSVDKATGAIALVDTESFTMDSGMKTAVFVQL
jgi:hypothetical protein